MKKNYVIAAGFVLVAGIWSCSNNNTHGDEVANDSLTTTTTTTGNATDMNAGTADNTPFSAGDSAFIMEAATGGMMEVQAGQIAQQKGMNQRVKDFGAMMVRDHSQANDELKSLVGNRIAIPTTLPQNMQQELDQLNSLSGKNFDSKYVSKMLEDHKKDVNKFADKAKSADDAALRNWAGKTLPVLQMHLDSIQAISKSMK